MFNEKLSLSIPLPSFFIPTFNNHGNYVMSLANFCRWLGTQAESLGVEIFPGFTASEVLFEENTVKGIVTGEMGISKDGEKKPSYQPSMELRGKYTIFAEGCRGHLGKQLIAKYNLDAGKDPQHYGIGFKEVWDIPAEYHSQGTVMHTLGWPSSGPVAGSYFYHAAMKSGMLAAETVFEAISSDRLGLDLTDYEERFKSSWVNKELYKGRNWSPFLHSFGALFGGVLAAIDQFIFRGNLPFTLDHKTPDYACMKKASDCKKIEYPKPDGIVSFDKLSSVFLSNTNHEEDQPCHLTLKDSSIPIAVNLPIYDEPAQRYCPAGVYEVVEKEGEKVFQINISRY